MEESTLNATVADTNYKEVQGHVDIGGLSRGESRDTLARCKLSPIPLSLLKLSLAEFYSCRAAKEKEKLLFLVSHYKLSSSNVIHEKLHNIHVMK